MNAQITVSVSDLAQKVINNLKNTVAKSPTGVGFVSIKGYENSKGEISNNLINVGVDYGKMKEKDIKTLENLDLTTFETVTDILTLEKARTALIEAFIKPDKIRSEGQKNAYYNICTGLKVHTETGELYIWGFRVSKTLIKKGEYKKVNSSALTIAKNELRKLCKTSKFVNYKVSEIETMKLNKNTLEF